MQLLVRKLHLFKPWCCWLLATTIVSWWWLWCQWYWWEWSCLQQRKFVAFDHTSTPLSLRAGTGKRHIKIIKNLTVRCFKSINMHFRLGFFQGPTSGVYNASPDFLIGLMGGGQFFCSWMKLNPSLEKAGYGLDEDGKCLICMYLWRNLRRWIARKLDTTGTMARVTDSPADSLHSSAQQTCHLHQVTSIYYSYWWSEICYLAFLIGHIIHRVPKSVPPPHRLVSVKSLIRDRFFLQNLKHS